MAIKCTHLNVINAYCTEKVCGINANFLNLYHATKYDKVCYFSFEIWNQMWTFSEKSSMTGLWLTTSAVAV